MRVPGGSPRLPVGCCSFSGFSFPAPGEVHSPALGLQGRSWAVSEPLCLCKHKVVASSVQRLRDFLPCCQRGVQQSGMPSRTPSTGAWAGCSAHHQAGQNHAVAALPAGPCLRFEVCADNPTAKGWSISFGESHYHLEEPEGCPSLLAGGVRILCLCRGHAWLRSRRCCVLFSISWGRRMDGRDTRGWSCREKGKGLRGCFRCVRGNGGFVRISYEH